MNPGVSEEIGKAAGATVDALRSTPVVLALVVFNVLFMIVVAYTQIKSAERWDHEVERWAEFARACQNVTTREKSQP